MPNGLLSALTESRSLARPRAEMRTGSEPKRAAVRVKLSVATHDPSKREQSAAHSGATVCAVTPWSTQSSAPPTSFLASRDVRASSLTSSSGSSPNLRLRLRSYARRATLSEVVVGGTDALCS
eukprot:2016028-Pleurochrysis_carterae.AAC.1